MRKAEIGLFRLIGRRFLQITASCIEPASKNAELTPLFLRGKPLQRDLACSFASRGSRSSGRSDLPERWGNGGSRRSSAGSVKRPGSTWTIRLKLTKRLILLILLVYLLPALFSAGLWAMKEHPTGYRNARWSSAGLLPPAKDDPPAAIYVYSAMTGGFKGAVASHAWIVLKAQNAGRYERYDKVGWGAPIRRNAYAADAYWYSNMPRKVVELHGAAAAQLIPKIEKAIGDYPYGKPGDYRIYPGPNSNTFVAHVLRQVPELGAVLPPDAVGRDYLPDGAFVHVAQDWRDLSLSLGGLVGLSVGLRSGIEVNVLGLVAGIDLRHPGIKVPGLGYFGVSSFAPAPQRTAEAT